MKPKFLKSISLFLCIGLTQWACQTNKETQVSPTVNVPITIEEARTWYQSRSSANARTAGKKEGELAYWKYAQASQLTNGTDVIVVPLLYNANVPVSVPSDENFVKQGDKFYLSGFDRNAYQIQQKLLISKDEQGNLRSVVITVIPDRKDQRKKEHVKKDKFSGVVLLMNESGDDFEIGWRYKNGKGVDIFYPRAKSANGRLATYSCKVGFYQKMAQSNSGGYNCSQNSSVCLPSAYVDLDGGFWVLIAEFEATCDDGVPNGAPTRQNPWDTNSSWVVADPNRGGAGGGPILSDPFNPTSGQTPIDYGMPSDLDPADAFAWEMANRIGNKIYFTEDEMGVIRDYPDLMYRIRNFAQQYNRKPDGSNLFTLSFADQQRFPKFTDLVRNLLNFVENDAKVRNALLHYTGYSYAKLMDYLKFGQGPQIHPVYDLTDRLGRPVIGLCDCDIYDKPNESKIQIKENYIRGYELDNSSSARKQATAFLLSVTVLHEFVHYGRNQNQLNDFSFEFGEGFEVEAFGVTIGKDNAGKLSYRLYQNR